MTTIIVLLFLDLFMAFHFERRKFRAAGRTAPRWKESFDEKSSFYCTNSELKFCFIFVEFQLRVFQP